MHFKSVIVALLTTRINCWTTTPTTQDRRAIITKLVTLPVLVAPLIANADDPSLFDQEIYNPNAPTANQKAVDMKRSSAPPPSRSSKPKESKEQVDPYSEEAVRAKRRSFASGTVR